MDNGSDSTDSIIYKHTLWHSTVFYMRFYNRYAVILQVVVNIYWSDSEIFCRGFMYSLLEVSKKS
jgi:hypothetical protein